VIDLRGRFVEPARVVLDGVEVEFLAAASRAASAPARLFLRGMFCAAWLQPCLSDLDVCLVLNCRSVDEAIVVRLEKSAANVSEDQSAFTNQKSP